MNKDKKVIHMTPSKESYEILNDPDIEIGEQMVTYKVYLKCPKCGEYMLYDGEMNGSYKYLHTCPSCGYTKETENKYPAMVYFPVDGSIIKKKKHWWSK